MAQVDARYVQAAHQQLAARTPPADRYRTAAVVVTGPLVWLIIERRPRR